MIAVPDWVRRTGDGKENQFRSTKRGVTVPPALVENLIELLEKVRETAEQA